MSKDASWLLMQLLRSQKMLTMNPGISKGRKSRFYLDIQGKYVCMMRKWYFEALKEMWEENAEKVE